MSGPQRIQMRRTKGWRKPEGAVYVGRPSRWGNPFHIVDGMGDCLFEIGREGPCPSLSQEERDRMVRAEAVRWYRHWLDGISMHQTEFSRWRSTNPTKPVTQRAPYTADDIRRELRGRDLVCWCPLDQPCHADVLLELANRGEGKP